LKGGSPKPAGISKESLVDAGKIRDWLTRSEKRLGLKDDSATLTWLIAASERALDVGDDPVGLFLSLAKELAAGETGKLEAYYDRAKQRLRDESPAHGVAVAKGIDDDDE
jgi:hypothetical protein